jgi:hypothetical protein
MDWSSLYFVYKHKFLSDIYNKPGRRISYSLAPFKIKRMQLSLLRDQNNLNFDQILQRTLTLKCPNRSDMKIYYMLIH